MGLMLQMPSFTKLLIMKYTPLVSTKKEFELWFWSSDGAINVIRIKGSVELWDHHFL